MPNIKDIYRDEDSGELPTYAWPGGYNLYYLDAENSTLCPKCANEQEKDRLIAQIEAEDEGYVWNGNAPGLGTLSAIIAYDVNYEDDDLYCDQCGEHIESAYGDPYNETKEIEESEDNNA